MNWPSEAFWKMSKKAFLNWSSGKDAMLALHRLKSRDDSAVDLLLTTLNTTYKRISMHGVRQNLLQQQADALHIPLKKIFMGSDIGLQTYNELMGRCVEELADQGYAQSVFGDILLEDLKSYRRRQLRPLGIEPVFPLWKEDTSSLAKEFIDFGYKAMVVCVNAAVLDRSFCGRLFDKNFLNDLPEDVDPCGENGEFHTFVFDGPLFEKPIDFEVGETLSRNYVPSQTDADCFTEERSWDTDFWFTDLK